MQKRLIAAGVTMIVLMTGTWGCRTGDPQTTSTVDGPTESGLYMVVDLAGGPSATSYPVSYLRMDRHRQNYHAGDAKNPGRDVHHGVTHQRTGAFQQ